MPTLAEEAKRRPYRSRSLAYVRIAGQPVCENNVDADIMTSIVQHIDPVVLAFFDTSRGELKVRRYRQRYMGRYLRLCGCMGMVAGRYSR